MQFFITTPEINLGLSKNAVNKEIRKSILDKADNDFALLNNGITILADTQSFTVSTGKENVGRLTLTNPQIINGGQTAYTLSEIYEDTPNVRPTAFDGKEVLVRVVVLDQNTGDSTTRHKFIQSISSSTNQQTEVREADRHSSDPRLLQIQKQIFIKYGHFLELKSGEFYDGLERGFLSKGVVINRIRLLRSYVAFSGRPTSARNDSEGKIYDNASLNNIFTSDVGSDTKLASEMMFGYRVHSFLLSLDRQTKEQAAKYQTSGYGLRYGKYAMVYACSLSMHAEFRKDLQSVSLEQIDQYVEIVVRHVQGKWKKFEDFVQEREANQPYFNKVQGLADFDTYYRGSTLKSDLDAFEWLMPGKWGANGNSSGASGPPSDG